MAYKVTVNGKEITYDAYTEFSRHTEEEWFAICLEMMKQERPDLYEKRKDDKDFVLCIGMAIDLEQRYEALLELLPQSAYSKAGTHPRWVADAVNNNTLDKGITQDDVKSAIEENETYGGLKDDLAEYFELKLPARKTYWIEDAYTEDVWGERKEFFAKNGGNVGIYWLATEEEK